MLSIAVHKPDSVSIRNDFAQIEPREWVRTNESVSRMIWFGFRLNARSLLWSGAVSFMACANGSQWVLPLLKKTTDLSCSLTSADSSGLCQSPFPSYWPWRPELHKKPLQSLHVYLHYKDNTFRSRSVSCIIQYLVTWQLFNYTQFCSDPVAQSV